MNEIRILNTKDNNFNALLDELLCVQQQTADQLRQTVQTIIDDVRINGASAVLRYTQQFDNNQVSSIDALRVKKCELQRYWQQLDEKMQQALLIAQQRIEKYAQKQRLESWQYREEDGSILGQQINALDSVGLYVPGGKAAYPSSVLMNAIPAKVAGVARLVMVAPAPNGIVNEMVMAAAHLCAVDEVWQIGGAQAVAALAYGCEGIAAVDKITGPGNQYVAAAKRAVFGKVGIDMIAGPSEVVIIADKSADASWIVADLFAQAEHDEMAQSIVITDDAALAQQIAQTLAKMLPQQPRQAVIAKSLQDRGAIIISANLHESIAIANRIAPEHLELMIVDAHASVASIKHAGAIFVGAHSNEVFGDYCAGANHVLPTNGTARFASPLGVYDFQKRTSIVALSEQGAQNLAPIASILAQGEGLHAHALSATLRAKS